VVYGTSLTSWTDTTLHGLHYTTTYKLYTTASQCTRSLTGSLTGLPVAAASTAAAARVVTVARHSSSTRGQQECRAALEAAVDALGLDHILNKVNGLTVTESYLVDRDSVRQRLWCEEVRHGVT